MKNFLLFSFLFFCSTIFSQKVYHGFHVASTINFDHTYSDTNYMYNAANGYKLGLSFEKDLDSTLSLVFEPGFDFRRNTYLQKVSNINKEFSDNVIWLEIPVYLRFKIGNNIKFVFDIGVSSQHLISYDNSSDQAASFQTKFSKTNYNSFFAFNYGIGISQNITKSNRLTIILKNRTAKNGILYKANQLSLNFVYAF